MTGQYQYITYCLVITASKHVVNIADSDITAKLMQPHVVCIDYLISLTSVVSDISAVVCTVKPNRQNTAGTFVVVVV